MSRHDAKGVGKMFIEGTRFTLVFQHACEIGDGVLLKVSTMIQAEAGELGMLYRKLMGNNV